MAQGSSAATVDEYGVNSSFMVDTFFFLPNTMISNRFFQD